MHTRIPSRLSIALFPVAAIAAALSACSAASDREPSGSSSQPLEGAFGTADCPSDLAAFLPQAMTLGRAIVATPEYAQCLSAGAKQPTLAGPYVACALDSATARTDLGSLLAATQSANATKAACRNDQPDGSDGFTEPDDEHGYSYGDVEEIKVATTPMRAYENLWLAGNPGGGFQAAKVIWHEAMHVHGYSHGANDARGNAACGYDGTTTQWNVNSAPYAAGLCIVDVGSTLLAAAAATEQKRYDSVLAWQLWQQVASGAITIDTAKLLIGKNWRREQATPLALGGAPVNDELFTATSQDWFAFTVGVHGPVHLEVATNTGQVPIVELVGPTTTTYATTGDGAGATLTQVLDPGTYYVVVSRGASNVASVTVSVAEPPVVAPTGCSRHVECQHTLDVICADSFWDPYLEHSYDGVTWAGHDWMSVFIDPNATYRVCQDSVTTGQTQCASLAGTPLTTSCSGQGAGGSTGGGSKPCRGTMCTYE